MKNMSKLNRGLRSVAVAAAIAASAVGTMPQAFGASATSATSVVWTKPEESLQWKTVMSASAPVTLNWPEGAASARLTVSWHGTVLGASTITDTSAKTTPLPLVAFPSALEDERIVDVSIEYRDRIESLLDSASVRLGCVTGVGSGVTRIVTDTNGKPWNRVGKSAVLQIPEDATALSIDKVAQDIGTSPGWWEWYRIASCEHNLELSKESGDCAATLQRLSGRTIILVR